MVFEAGNLRGFAMIVKPVREALPAAETFGCKAEVEVAVLTIPGKDIVSVARLTIIYQVQKLETSFVDQLLRLRFHQESEIPQNSASAPEAMETTPKLDPRSNSIYQSPGKSE